MPHVVFRADAGAGIGAGHAMRCIALAEAFQDAGWTVGFAATAETFASIEPMQPFPGERLVLTEGAEREPEALRAGWPQGVDVLVVDHYRRDQAFEERCRAWARRIAVIDDLANRPHAADVVIDASAATAEPYRDLVPAGCRVLAGPEHAIVARRFEPLRGSALRRREGGAVGRILIGFGQNDAADATGTALAALDDIGFGGDVDVVLGATAPHLDAVRQKMAGRRRLHVNASDMHTLIERADLALGAAGATAWERCFLGLPSVLVLLADNQRGNVALVADAGAGIDAGPVDGGLRQRLAAILGELIGSGDRLRAMADAAAALVDGRGKQRILKAVTES